MRERVIFIFFWHAIFKNCQHRLKADDTLELNTMWGQKVVDNTFPYFFGTTVNCSQVKKRYDTYKDGMMEGQRRIAYREAETICNFFV